MTAAAATVATATATTGTVGERDANNQLQKVTINLCGKRKLMKEQVSGWGERNKKQWQATCNAVPMQY